MLRQSKRILILVAITTFCAGICRAQEVVPVIEDLPNDSFIVKRAGKEYRAINADKAREIQKLRIDFEAANRINGEKDLQIEKQAQEIALLKKDVEITSLKAESFRADFERAQADAKRNLGLFLGERELRREAGTFVPHGETTKLDKFLKIFDSPVAVAGFKIVIPVLQTTRAFTRCQ